MKIKISIRYENMMAASIFTLSRKSCLQLLTFTVYTRQYQNNMINQEILILISSCNKNKTITYCTVNSKCKLADVVATLYVQYLSTCTIFNS